MLRIEERARNTRLLIKALTWSGARFEESKHKRVPKGQPGGGRFANKPQDMLPGFEQFGLPGKFRKNLQSLSPLLGTLMHRQSLGDSLNSPVVGLVNGKKVVQKTMKPRGWVDIGQTIKSEVVASRINDLLGWDIVPKTIKTGPRTVRSEFIDNLREPGSDEQVDEKSMHQVYALDTIMLNADRFMHHGNVAGVLKDDGVFYLKGIDYGLSLGAVTNDSFMNVPISEVRHYGETNDLAEALSGEEIHPEVRNDLVKLNNLLHDESKAETMQMRQMLGGNDFFYLRQRVHKLAVGGKFFYQ